jgi:hypothetical protein
MAATIPPVPRTQVRCFLKQLSWKKSLPSRKGSQRGCSLLATGVKHGNSIINGVSRRKGGRGISRQKGRNDEGEGGGQRGGFSSLF